ncbi:MAG TPA: hypothetical protein VF380_00305, partial [Solirubrobacteraceae bacterium]
AMEKSMVTQAPKAARPARSVSCGRVRLAAMLTGLLLALAAGTGASSALAAEPGVGVNNLAGPQMTAEAALGAHWVRMFVSWRSLQPARGPISAGALGTYEQVFQKLPAGTKVILDVFGTPRWETGSSDEHAPPANPHDYAAFVGALAQRFAGHVSAYEIWNEEDESRWWSGGPDPGAYARLLEATYPVVKGTEPKATVVLGGLTGNDYPFLQSVYAAGAKGSFDAVGVHTDTACNVLSPYVFLRGVDNRMIPDSFLAYREVHATMLANGDDKPIWMTELSWRTTGATCNEGAWAGQKPEGVSDEQQATFLSQAYHCLAQAPYVQVALWFPIQDEGALVSGLVRADGSHKPSFTALRSYVRYGDRLTEPCGVFTGPKITVGSPTNRKRYEGPLSIHVRASSSQGVFRIRLLIDGRLIRNYDGRNYPTTLRGAINWMGAKHLRRGRHTLSFLAYDKQRNTSRVNVVIYHGFPRHHGAVKGP